MRDLDSQLKDKAGQKTVLWCDLSLGTPRPLVHLHQQLKTPLMPGRPGGVPTWGML